MSKQFEDTKVYSDPKLKLKYEIVGKLGQGCFGVIYKAINRSMKRQVALKLEFLEQGQNLNSKKSSIGNQICVLEKLKGTSGVPKLYAAGKWSHGYYMEIQLLSSSLYDQKDKEFSYTQICMIMCQLIQILKNIHKKNVIHQDLKPQNIMRNQKGVFHIIDFGLSSVINQDDDISQQKRRGFIGTPRYASLAAHKGISQRPKDDIESLLYVIGALYLKRAPWFQLKGPPTKKLQKIQKVKKTNSMIWLKQCGQCFSLSYEYLMQLNTYQQVNYNYLTNLFQNSRKSTTIKQPQQNPQYKLNRRRSDADCLKFDFPIINIHLAERKTQDVQCINKENKINTLTFKDLSEDVDATASQANFSQRAQNDYMGILQILTEKIFNVPQNTNQHKQSQQSKTLNVNRASQNIESLQQRSTFNSVSFKQSVVNSISKYQCLHFKNPFKT